ncbi:MAG: hypothetical protein F4Y44_02440 [Chloroflexi bacterium]|nr:hypothetical protein [Chloroflexota bacterium]
MDEFTLRHHSDRYLIGKITLEQLKDCLNHVIVDEMRHGERDAERSSLAAKILGILCVGNDVTKIHGYFDEEEFRQELAAHLYMQQLTVAKARIKSKAS